MRIFCGKDYADMSRKAANLVSAQLLLKPDSVLGFASVLVCVMTLTNGLLQANGREMLPMITMIVGSSASAWAMGASYSAALAASAAVS